MPRIIVLLVSMIIAGCATHTPIPHPAPMPCEVRVKGECRDMTAGEKTGAVTRGHGEEVKDIK
jgi:hypothetical protein